MLAHSDKVHAAPVLPRTALCQRGKAGQEHCVQSQGHLEMEANKQRRQ